MVRAIEASLVLSEASLGARQRKLTKAFRPLTKTTVVGVTRGRNGNNTVMSAQSGPQPSSNIQDHRFPTFVDGFSANYREDWRFLDSLNLFCLERANLHLYCRKPLPKGPAEVLALHCAANAPDSSSSYGHGLHMHIRMAPSPLDKAHLPLELSQRLTILSSLDQMDKFFGLYVTMISQEILGHAQIRDLLK